MIDLEEFLKDLSNTELAIFYSYRYDDFIEYSRTKIDREIKSRRLSKEQIKYMFEKGLPVPDPDKYYCPRCHSTRAFEETDFVMDDSTDFSIKSFRCELCGYDADKDKPKGSINWLKKLLGLYHSLQIRRH